jgi:hypothetical protein
MTKHAQRPMVQRTVNANAQLAADTVQTLLKELKPLTMAMTVQRLLNAHNHVQQMPIALAGFT